MDPEAAVFRCLQTTSMPQPKTTTRGMIFALIWRDPTYGMLHLVDPELLVEVQSLKAAATNEPGANWVAGHTGRGTGLLASRSQTTNHLKALVVDATERGVPGAGATTSSSRR